MLVSRLYEPKDNEVFYHYCSVDSFMAICNNKTIRFTDVNMLNDYQEGVWGYRIFEEAATRILNDQNMKAKFPHLDKNFFDRVDEIVSSLQLFFHPVIACFSKDPDVLSEWRGYADDGLGFCVGISGAALKYMPVSLLEVEYDKKGQIAEMMTALVATYQHNLDDSNSFGSRFREDCILIGAWRYGFKNPAFSEEKEVRCLHMLDVRTDDERPRLVDAGGQSAEKTVEGAKVNYRANRNAIVAYIDLPIPVIEDRPQIQEVWVGPRNVNGPGNIIYFMSECGLKGHSIKPSAASYR